MRLPAAGSKARRAVVAILVLFVALAAAATLLLGLPSGRGTPAAAQATKATRPRLAPSVARVTDASQANDLFGKHSWYVPPPPPPAVAPPPPPPPSAPPFPYAAMGSFAPDGSAPVYFLSRADRVIDVRVGDRIDGVYEFESADKGQLVFNYLPLNIRQSVPLGAPP
jgi:hypothetical protein